MNRGDHKQAVLDEISLDSTDTFITTAILNRFYARSVQWLANLKNWQQTQIARKITIVAAGDETDEYWDYPENFKTDSVYRIDVDGVRYKPLTWEEYLNYKEDTPQGKEIYTDHRRQLFIYPTVTNGAVLSIWGHEIIATPDNDADEHPFTGEQLLEEAINRYLMGLCYKKRDGSYYEKGKALYTEALTLALQAWEQQQKAQANKKTENAEAWEHIDFTQQRAGNRVTRRGSFNLDQ